MPRMEYADTRERVLTDDSIRRLKLAQAAACKCKDGKCSDCVDRQFARTLKGIQKLTQR